MQSGLSDCDRLLRDWCTASSCLGNNCKQPCWSTNCWPRRRQLLIAGARRIYHGVFRLHRCGVGVCWRDTHERRLCCIQACRLVAMPCAQASKLNSQPRAYCSPDAKLCPLLLCRGHVGVLMVLPLRRQPSCSVCAVRRPVPNSLYLADIWRMQRQPRFDPLATTA